MPITVLALAKHAAAYAAFFGVDVVLLMLNQWDSAFSFSSDSGLRIILSSNLYLYAVLT